jgi:hypothetical protein
VITDLTQEESSSAAAIEQEANDKHKEIISFCKEDKEQQTFFQVEKTLAVLLSQLGVLYLQLFLSVRQDRLDYSLWLESGLYYFKSQLKERAIKTAYGKVRYARNYLEKKEGAGGFYPLDAALGLTGDGFSPLVISLAAKLATRVSFPAAVLLFRSFYGWSPSSDSMQCLVLGLGREAAAYVETAPPPQEDGEILVIEIDGKATPTATDEELGKRRGRRASHTKGCKCGCQRHRSKKKRKARGKKKRRKKGDKSKNGKSITLVAIYTLKIGSDGKLHGPINKKIWGSYAPRKEIFAFARRMATKRGFPPGTDKRVHIVVDGEKCLWDGMSKLFPEATFALDICHLEEKIWDVGRKFHKEGSKELEEWAEAKRSLLYTGSVDELLSQLKELEKSLSRRAKRDEGKRKALNKLINYMEPRISMMNYKELIEADLVIASGIIEGAARYVVGERMDCSGMRWIPGRAEALLHLRCMELNGDWDGFFAWAHQGWGEKLRRGEKVLIRTEQPIELPDNAPKKQQAGLLDA